VSQIISLFETDSLVPNVFRLKNIVSDAVRVEVDTVGFLYGHGYDVEIVQVIRPDSIEPVVFGVDIPTLKPEADMAGRFTNAMRLFADTKGAYLQRCLADLREAIRSPRDTGFFCYRAVESLRQFFVAEAGASSDRASWELMRSTLKVERSAFDYIKSFADVPRHGGSKGISDGERADVFLVNAYIDYALGGYRLRA
jgi:hypothetical protein